MIFNDIQSKNIDEFAEWLDKYGAFDGSPWMKWFDEKFCSKCKPVMCHCRDSKDEIPCSWCELEKKCKFFTNLDHTPDNKDIIKMWLESEIDEECKEKE